MLLSKKIIHKVGITKLEEFAEFSIVIGCVCLLMFLLTAIGASFLETIKHFFFVIYRKMLKVIQFDK